MEQEAKRPQEEERKPYNTPAVIWESDLETKAGSTIQVEPLELFDLD